MISGWRPGAWGNRHLRHGDGRPVSAPWITLADVPDPARYRPAPGTIPDSPGVYRFRDPGGRVIYVGKAKSLRQRLNSYFADIGGAAPADRADGHQRGRRRVDGGVDRGRGAAAGIQLDQGVRPAVQRPLPRRQVLPGTGRHGRRGVPAAAGDARPASQGRPVLRAVRPRLGDPGDAGHAAAGVPGPDLLGRGVPPVRSRSAGPACWATSASARRRASAGSPPTSTARSSTTSAISWPARPTR